MEAYFRSIACIAADAAAVPKQCENDDSAAAPPLALVAEDVTICNDSDGDDVGDSGLILAFGSAEACAQTAEAAYKAEKTGESLVIQCDSSPEHDGSETSSAATSLPNTRIRVFSKVARAPERSMSSAASKNKASSKLSRDQPKSQTRPPAVEATVDGSVAMPVVQSSTNHLCKACPVLESKLRAATLTASQVAAIRAALCKVWEAFRVACLRALALTYVLLKVMVVLFGVCACSRCMCICEVCAQ